MLQRISTDSRDLNILHTPGENCDQKIQEAYDYWRRIHPPKGLPGRKHLDPTDIPKLLGYTRLLENIGQPPRFRVRLIGTEFSERLGYDITGRYLDEVFENFNGTDFHKRLLRTIETRKPVWSQGPVKWFCQGSFRSVERIHLPLASDGATIDMIWSVTCYQS